jgi:hypothetical protein
MASSNAVAGGATDLHRILEDIAHYLPSQSPIKPFVHHSTLHHFEDLEFFEELDAASDIYGASTALPETTYQRYLAQGRVTYGDLNRAFLEYGYHREPWVYAL